MVRLSVEHNVLEKSTMEIPKTAPKIILLLTSAISAVLLFSLGSIPMLVLPLMLAKFVSFCALFVIAGLEIYYVWFAKDTSHTEKTWHYAILVLTFVIVLCSVFKLASLSWIN